MRRGPRVHRWQYEWQSGGYFWFFSGRTEGEGWVCGGFCGGSAVGTGAGEGWMVVVGSAPIGKVRLPRREREGLWLGLGPASAVRWEHVGYRFSRRVRNHSLLYILLRTRLPFMGLLLWRPPWMGMAPLSWKDLCRISWGQEYNFEYETKTINDFPYDTCCDVTILLINYYWVWSEVSL